MAVNREKYTELNAMLKAKGVTLVAVSKTKPVEDILELYELGQRDFGENYVQEMVDKATVLPADIRWHFIGHLQRNKVKYIAPFVSLIHGVDSWRLLEEINSQAGKKGRVIDCLLQVHIASEETKFGLDAAELGEVMDNLAKPETAARVQNVRICGLMGMASFSSDTSLVRSEFHTLHSLADLYKERTVAAWSPGILSMGMSADFETAIEEGSTMVRIGSLLFGERKKPADS